MRQKTIGFLIECVPDRQKPRASVERLREASKIFEDFNIAQTPAHVNPQKHRFRISLTLRPLAYAPRRIVRLSRAWSALAVREDPRRPDAGFESWKGGPVKPRGYVIKTLDALAGAGVLRRHCERDPIPAHTGDGSGKSDGDVSSYRSFPQDPRCQLRLDGDGRLAVSALDQNSVTVC